MEDPVVDKCTVQIIVNGDDTRTVVFPLSSTTDVDFVEKEMRSTCNVAHGTLSSSSRQPVVVYTLVAGGTYYFLEFTAQDVNAEEIPHSSYMTPVWIEALQHNPGGFAAVASGETKGSVWKARKYAERIEDLRASYHRKRNERFYCVVEMEGAIKLFRIYFVSRSTHSMFPIFQCPFHQVFLRDCYFHFRLCDHDMAAFSQFLSDNGGVLPPTGLPWSPVGHLRNHLDPDLQTFRNPL